jgi:hypothetical protein
MAKIRHGHASGGKLTREYVSWREMHRRCRDTKYNRFHRYGGRGITVCSEWSGPEGFGRFLAVMGLRPKNTTLDRIRTEDNYEPGNCKWSTVAEQNRNRSTARLITYEDKTLSMVVWAELLGIAPATIGARLDKLGWSVEKTLTTPVRAMRAKI